MSNTDTEQSERTGFFKRFATADSPAPEDPAPQPTGIPNPADGIALQIDGRWRKPGGHFRLRTLKATILDDGTQRYQHALLVSEDIFTLMGEPERISVTGTPQAGFQIKADPEGIKFTQPPGSNNYRIGMSPTKLEINAWDPQTEHRPAWDWNTTTKTLLLHPLPEQYNYKDKPGSAEAKLAKTETEPKPDRFPTNEEVRAERAKQEREAAEARQPVDISKHTDTSVIQVEALNCIRQLNRIVDAIDGKNTGMSFEVTETGHFKLNFIPR